MRSNNRQVDYEVEVIISSEKVDLKYKYQNPINKREWSLKEQLEKYVTSRLKSGLSFKKKESRARILDQKITKSGETGNFQFDPFVYSVKIYLRNVMEEKFDSYRLGEHKTIAFDYPVTELIEEKGKEQITDDTPMDQLIDNIGKEFQIQISRLNLYKENFKTNFIRKVGDVKNWKEDEISKTNSLPLRVLKEVYKASNKIDYYSQKMFASKKLKNNAEVATCARLGNSHKILRYCVFKNNARELEQVAYLNYENIRRSLGFINQELKFQSCIDENLKRFLYQFALPHGSKYVYSRGAIFNGPPGTGKTVITQLLMYLCGFSLISQGISASDFSKSYVGEAGRMINELFSRANCCSYLACSIAIDEIEGAFPNRNDSSQKNKGEATSQFLSVIEGNKNIQNLFILSSTNHINKIDEAILRRLGDRFDLTRLNYSDREKILKQTFDAQGPLIKNYLQENSKQKQILLNLTMNFTGAAFKKLLSQFESSLQNKVYLQDVKRVVLKDEEVENMITKIANDYKIIFGSKTLPELVHSNEQKKKYLSKQFLENMESHFMFISIEKLSKSSEIILAYINKRKDKHGEEIKELQQLKFNTYLELKPKDRQSIDGFANFLVKQIQQYFNSTVKLFGSIASLNQAFHEAYSSSSEEPKIFLITDQLYRKQNENKDVADILNQLQCFNKDKQNVFVFYVTANVQVVEFFGMRRSQKNYSGRVMVEIDKAPRIIYELKPTFARENLVYIENYFSSDEQPKPDDLIPNIMKFFNSNKLSNIFMIDNYFLEAKSAFSSEKQIETIRAVIQEAQKLTNVGLIINFDSLLVSSKIGKEDEEFEIDNKSLYRSLINICRTFSCKNDRVQRWIALFVKSSSLIKKIRSDIFWPEMPEQVIQKKKEQELNRKRICDRCGQQYTQKQNQEQRKCFQHPGVLINTLLGETTNIDFETALRENQMQEHRKEIEQDKDRKEFPNYVYSCCFANVKETENVCSKMHVFRHIEENEKGKSADELHLYRDNNIQKWETNFMRFKQELLKSSSNNNNTGNRPPPSYPTTNRLPSSNRSQRNIYPN